MNPPTETGPVDDDRNSPGATAAFAGRPMRVHAAYKVPMSDPVTERKWSAGRPLVPSLREEVEPKLANIEIGEIPLVPKLSDIW
ncbi:hypothetical protein [Actinoplanes sp. NPDC051411]|uniref:hypothetical protein n=1 Tax=Actinoplanes sp. NPDC051411 TaxID=3155522 RepID=UPI003431BBE9